MNHWSRHVASMGGIGFLPKAPGTWGSLAALPLGAALAAWLGQPALLAMAALLTLVGWLACRHVQEKDPGWIVIDEVAGQLIALAVVPLGVWNYLAAFILFRLLDITKPFPVGWADRNLKGAWGVLADDLLAGLMAALILLAARHAF